MGGGGEGVALCTVPWGEALGSGVALGVASGEEAMGVAVRVGGALAVGAAAVGVSAGERDAVEEAEGGAEGCAEALPAATSVPEMQEVGLPLAGARVCEGCSEAVPPPPGLRVAVRQALPVRVELWEGEAGKEAPGESVPHALEEKETVAGALREPDCVARDAEGWRVAVAQAEELALAESRAADWEERKLLVRKPALPEAVTQLL